MIGVRALLLLAAASSFGCGQEPSGPLDPTRVAEGGGEQPAVFHVRDSGFVHVGIGRSVELRIAAAAAGHPLRSSARELVSTSWTSRDSSVASVQGGVLRGRAEGMTWLVWAQGAVIDSTPLVVSAPPVGYLSPRRLAVDINAVATPLQAPPGDSLLFCTNPQAGSGVELTAGCGVRATQPARIAVRGRTRAGVNVAAVVTTNMVTTPPQNPDPVPPPAPQPPPAGARTVTLQLHRFAGAEQATVSSNAIPLPPGWARPASVDSISLRVAGVEVPVHVAALFGKHADGSLRSVLVQTDITPSMVSSGASLVIGVRRSETRSPLASAASASEMAVLLPSSPDYLVSTQVVGRTTTRAAATFASPAFAAYEFKFDQFQQIHWDARGSSWGDNFYDRAFAYLAFWVRTGNPTFWDRGTRLARSYRIGYLEANAYGAAEWWTYLEGLAVHYWVTGDSASRDAVYKTAENLWRSRGGPRIADPNHEWMDNRIQAKVLGSKLLSIQLEAPPFGIATDWRTGARTDLGRILQSQAPDGAFRFRGTCFESSNFMSGMLSSVLIDYFEHFEPDARIPIAVERNFAFLRNTQWLPGEKLFKYYSGSCATGDTSPGLDLNGQFLEPIGWLAHRKSDRSWFEFGDLVLSGLVERTWMHGPKQFNQAYVLSWRYHWFRSQSGLP